MRKITILSSVILALSLYANSETANRVEIGISAMSEKVDSDSRIDDHILLYGLRATVYESEVNKYGFNLSYEGAMNVSYQAPFTSIETDIHRVLANLVIDGEEEYHILPYVMFGVGYEHLSDEVKGETSQAIGNVAVGFKYDLGNGFNSALEGRYIGKFDTSDNDWSIGLVFGYDFSNSSKKVFNLHEDKERLTSADNLPNTQKRAVTVIKVDPRVDYESGESYTVTSENQSVDEVESANGIGEVVNGDIGDYYIQVAAFKKTPSTYMIRKLNSIGYENAITKYRNGKRLVLVGPYLTKEEANEAKAGLYSIAPDAFITTIK
jgi:hypothetical protein